MAPVALYVDQVHVVLEGRPLLFAHTAKLAGATPRTLRLCKCPVGQFGRSLHKSGEGLNFEEVLVGRLLVWRHHAERNAHAVGEVPCSTVGADGLQARSGVPELLSPHGPRLGLRRAVWLDIDADQLRGPDAKLLLVLDELLLLPHLLAATGQALLRLKSGRVARGLQTTLTPDKTDMPMRVREQTPP